MVSRREFIGLSAASLAAVALPGSAPVLAAEPVTRTGRPYFKLSLAAYSFNRQLRRAADGTAEMTLLDFIDFCAEQDLAATELTSYYFPEEVTDEYLLQIKQRTFHLGLDISGTAIRNDFCQAPGPKRTADLAWTRRWIDYSAMIGAPVIRIFAGNVAKGDSDDVAIERCIAGINESVAYAATKGVVLALENHGGITATPEKMLKIVKGVDQSPWFGVNFDSGNFRTDDPYRDLEQIAPYAVNAQVKVAVAPNGGPKQPSDLKRVVDILKAAAYRGYLVLEYEEPENPRVEIPKYLNQLRELIA